MAWKPLKVYAINASSGTNCPRHSDTIHQDITVPLLHQSISQAAEDEFPRITLAVRVDLLKKSSLVLRSFSWEVARLLIAPMTAAAMTQYQ